MKDLGKLNFKGLDRALDSTDKPVVISAGISLSNSPHIGHMREFYIADGIADYLTEAGIDSTVVAIADDADPLKKLYADMPPEYKAFVGRPLFDVPDHTEEHSSRAEKNLYEFRETLGRLGMNMSILRSTDLYSTEKMCEIKKTVLEHTDDIKAILTSITGSEAEENKGLINVVCPACGRVSANYTTGAELQTAQVVCSHCRDIFDVDLLAPEHKFRWRVDWPARWSALGVDIEPVAEDHATKGGSYHSASIIVSDVLQTPAPIPVEYRWARLRTGEAIHGSSSPMTAYHASRIVAPTALRAFFRNTPMNRELVIDPQNMVYDALKSLPEVNDVIPTNAVMRELYTIAARTDTPPSEVAESLYAITDKTVHSFIDSCTYKDNESAPETLIDSKYKQNAYDILSKIVEIEWSADFSHDDYIRQNIDPELATKKIFQTLYLILLGQKHGPRMDKLLAYIGKERVTEIVNSANLN